MVAVPTTAQVQILLILLVAQILLTAPLVRQMRPAAAALVAKDPMVVLVIMEAAVAQADIQVKEVIVISDLAAQVIPEKAAVAAVALMARGIHRQEQVEAVVASEYLVRVQMVPGVYIMLT